MNEDPIEPLNSPVDIQSEKPSLKNHLMPTKAVLIITITTILILLLAFISFSRRMDTDSVVSTNNTTQSPSTPTTYPEDESTINTNFSYFRDDNPAKTYSIIIHDFPKSDSPTGMACEIRFITSNYTGDISMLPPLDTFNCGGEAEYGMGLQNPKIPWINNNEYVIERELNIFVAYNINSTSRTVLEYDVEPHKINVLNGNATGSVWLMSENISDLLGYWTETRLYLIDSAGETLKEYSFLKENNTYGYIYPSYYDTINNGFFVMAWLSGETKPGETTFDDTTLSSYRAYFIDDESLSLKLIDQSEPAYGSTHPSCEFYQNAEIISDRNKITINNTICLSLPDEVKERGPLTFTL